MMRRLRLVAIYAIASVVEFLACWAKEWASERLKQKDDDE